MDSQLTAILLVDDLRDNLVALEAIVRGSGRQIHCASSGEQALSLLLQHEFALAIMDVQMPGMSGFQLAEMMRTTEATRQIPIIFVTAAGHDQNYSFLGYEQGAVDFLHKPLDIHAVCSKVAVFEKLFQQRLTARRQFAAMERSKREQDKLMKELIRVRSELEQAVAMRDKFMSIAAHELRTPLGNLRMERQLLSMQLDRGAVESLDAPELRTMVASDGRQITSMTRLIDDMFDMTRMRNGKLSIAPVRTDLTRLVHRVEQNLLPQAESTAGALDIRIRADIVGHWDEFRIEQIITNLISNALRYGRDGPVVVDVDLAGSGAMVRVTDQGIGIAQADLERIFSPFDRGAAHVDSPGLGLGLYIARQLAESHGGAIEVESEYGAGSSFTLTLPLDALEPRS